MNYMNDIVAAEKMLQVLREKYKNAKSNFIKEAIVKQANQIITRWPGLKKQSNTDIAGLFRYVVGEGEDGNLPVVPFMHRGRQFVVMICKYDEHSSYAYEQRAWWPMLFLRCDRDYSKLGDPLCYTNFTVHGGIVYVGPLDNNPGMWYGIDFNHIGDCYLTNQKLIEMMIKNVDSLITTVEDEIPAMDMIIDNPVQRVGVTARIALDGCGTKDSSDVVLPEDGSLIVSIFDGKGNRSYRAMPIDFSHVYDTVESARHYCAILIREAIADYENTIPTLWDSYVNMSVDPQYWDDGVFTDKLHITFRKGKPSFAWGLENQHPTAPYDGETAINHLMQNY